MTRKVAVLGVPRGGTSMAAGLLRILGYAMPISDGLYANECPFSEDPRLRLLDNPERPTLNALVRRVSALPDGVVWKDPAIGQYAHLIDWSGWDVIVVHRHPSLVQASEERFLGWESARGTAKRAIGWMDAISAALGDHPAMHLSMDQSRLVPVTALEQIAGHLELEVTSDQRRMAETFVQNSSGYRCPMASACVICNREVS